MTNEGYPVHSEQPIARTKIIAQKEIALAISN